MCASSTTDISIIFLIYVWSTHRAHPPFPTRRSSDLVSCQHHQGQARSRNQQSLISAGDYWEWGGWITPSTPFLNCSGGRSEEHTSELQSRGHLVCRLLLEKQKLITTGFRYSVNPSLSHFLCVRLRLLIYLSSF